ncbi:hypothetical protein GH714_034278 [Hevea brasiliensis]|uniref:Zinc knuckle CX2CX4HX4C domain-containing protein n=1 Tax=Hevea brasiliensis TaxID=3981 RepID=A0A6A6KKI5_HEVBR|nr:hypothetical protein GH714_034278 [Hevea brasiliensis]
MCDKETIITSGFHLNKGGDKKDWIKFKYERLPHFCFFCGRIGHMVKSYEERAILISEGKKVMYSLKYSASLIAKPYNPQQWLPTVPKIDQFALASLSLTAGFFPSEPSFSPAIIHHSQPMQQASSSGILEHVPLLATDAPNSSPQKRNTAVINCTDPLNLQQTKSDPKNIPFLPTTLPENVPNLKKGKSPLGSSETTFETATGSNVKENPLSFSEIP